MAVHTPKRKKNNNNNKTGTGCKLVQRDVGASLADIEENVYKFEVGYVKLSTISHSDKTDSLFNLLM